MPGKKRSNSDAGPPAKKAKTDTLAKAAANLGTETAYAVALEAGAMAKTRKVYPLHIGDLNFPTPQVVKDALNKALDAGKTGYCPAAGIPQLQEAVAEFFSRTRKVAYTPANVAIQPGGKIVIAKFLMSVMNPGEGVLYPSPGYPIYESQVDYLGGLRQPYGFIETPNGMRTNMEQLEKSISKKTRVLIYNNFNNPTGATADAAELDKIAELAVKHDLWVLSDEAYWDLVYEGIQESVVSRPGMLERTVLLHTFSKSWSMTGWRCGAAVGPEPVIKKFAQFNVNLEACTCHFVQHAAIACLKDPAAAQFTADLKKQLQARRDALVPLINAVPGLSISSPASTFYLWINASGAMEMLGIDQLEEFRKRVLAETGVSFCTREHFGRPVPGEESRFIRFAYSGIDTELAAEGLKGMAAWIEANKKA